VRPVAAAGVAVVVFPKSDIAAGAGVVVSGFFGRKAAKRLLPAAGAAVAVFSAGLPKEPKIFVVAAWDGTIVNDCYGNLVNHLHLS
jgi:hypothetical protein